MKRYRDENGKLIASISQIKEETLAEAEKYFEVGKIYNYSGESREYVLVGKYDGVAHFHSYDGYQMFIPVKNLGTFLPDVASDDNMLILVAE